MDVIIGDIAMNAKTEVDSFQLDLLKKLFAKPVAIAGMKPIRNGVKIAVYLSGCGPVLLTKIDGVPEVVNESPKVDGKPDLTFHIPKHAMESLATSETENVGEVGIAILKLMTAPEESNRIQAKVHIGPLDLMLKGYLGVIPLGGATVMKFLASRGLTGMGKIKDTLSKMRS